MKNPKPPAKMKNSILFLFTIFTITTANSQVYIDATIDPNVLFGTFENPRMDEHVTGVDWDFEIGATENRFSVFLYYGRFEAIKYQNYGIGTGFNIVENPNIDWSVGTSVGSVLRRQQIGLDLDRFGWASWIQWNVRTTATLWWTDNIGLSARIQYQQRGDIKIHGIIEGGVGIKYKFVNN